MKSASKLNPLGWAWRRSALGFAAWMVLFAPSARATSSDTLFSVVPSNDPVYGQLHQLSEAQLLTPGEANPPLTRFDVARDIQKAQDRYDAIVVAQASPAPAVPSASSSAPVTPKVIYKAGVVLHNLSETYRYELDKLRESIKSLGTSITSLEGEEYALRKRVKGIEQYLDISIHGLGRAFGFTQQYSGPYSGVTFNYPGTRLTDGYLDLEPKAVVTKEIKFSSVIRLQANFSSPPIDAEESSNNFLVEFRRMTLEFNPSWLSATFGDFEESYTPLTLWNRDDLDLMYKPEMWARQDEILKYESYLNHEPDWPLRGMRLGTNILWPDSDLLDRMKLSTFVNMIQNGFDETGNYGGWYFGPHQFTSWLVGGSASVQSKKWYGAGASWQAKVDAYGLVLDEPIGSNQPGYAYNPNDPSTWAHQYLTGSVRPDLRVGLGDEVYAGAAAEFAYSDYQDDKLDADREIGDWAFSGAAYLQVDRFQGLGELPGRGPLFLRPNGPDPAGRGDRSNEYG